ncbi:MAG: hypothetical protein J6B71_07475, partial [Clostridia bacterium]|nr:hypothetical protein [Clostridia bacterium]
MKRILCLICASLMLLSCFASFPVIAASDSASSTACIGYQLSEVYQNSAGQSVRNIRFVAIGNDLDCQEVGFTIQANSFNKYWDKSSARVYRSLRGKTSDGKSFTAVSAEDYDVEYLFAMSIIGVPADQATDFEVLTYSIDDSGVRQYESTKSCTVLPSNPNYVCMDFSSNGNALYANENGSTADGSGRTLKYSTTKYANLSYWVQAGLSAGTLKNSHKYVRVVYRIESEQSNAVAKFGMVSPANAASVSVDIKANTDGFVISDTLTLTDSLYNRLSDKGAYTAFFGIEVSANDSSITNAECVIQSVYFFESEADANAFDWGTVKEPKTYTPVFMTFGDGGSATGATWSANNSVSFDESNQAYISSDFAPQFNTTDAITEEHVYIRVLYSITGANSEVSLKLWNTANGNDCITWSGLSATDGFELTEPARLSGTMVERYRTKLNNALTFSSASTASVTYKVKALYFFADAESATNFEIPVVLDFSSESKMNSSGVSFYHPTATQQNFIPEGRQEFTTVNNTGALSLLYEAYLSDTRFPSYRLMYQVDESVCRLTKADCWMRIKYMTTDTFGCSVQVVNNADGSVKTLINDTSASKGNFAVSDPISLADSWMMERMIAGYPISLGYTSILGNSDFYIAEITFFESKEAAYAYYGDRESAVTVTNMRFGYYGTNGMITSNDRTAYNIDEIEGTVNIQYASDGLYGKYCVEPKFAEAGLISEEHSFMRVLYSAQNPTGVSTVTLTVASPANGEKVEANGISNTNGAYVLTPTMQMSDHLVSRFANGMHLAMNFSATTSGADYRVKALYFFKTKAEADSFMPPEDIKSNVTVNTQPLSSYSIVVPSNAVTRELNAAKS